MKPYRCPRCREIATRFRGVGTVTDLLRILPDNRAEFWRDADDFAPQYVLGECECGHKWKIRGVLDVAGIAEKLGAIDTETTL